ncbi:unnamed protein product [Vitrella brassicaformis CCMP3155]|uniref:Uncharacterized protein n=1 Tax=Vitrella brassicaformis (strain CCMP3155) TaxID=1169540 RepID=A0A0G4EIJ9_VITBC|nr:unnamed protein product [Vitrella brassicaformis CCMP3155]|eukprot:CEL96823.1 unnamed protein product [Vitrella brassicaformis CCMP3155]
MPRTNMPTAIFERTTTPPKSAVRWRLSAPIAACLSYLVACIFPFPRCLTTHSCSNGTAKTRVWVCGNVHVNALPVDTVGDFVEKAVLDRHIAAYELMRNDMNSKVKEVGIEKERELETKNKEIADKDGQIRQLQQSEAQLRHQICAMEQHIAALQQQIMAMQPAMQYWAQVQMAQQMWRTQQQQLVGQAVASL